MALRGDVVILNFPFTDHDGASSGLRAPSLISCNNLFTIEQEDIIQTLGHLSDPLMQKLNDALKAALELL